MNYNPLLLVQLKYNSFCLGTVQINIYFYLQPKEEVVARDDGAVGYIFTVQNGSPGNNYYRNVLVCALFRSILPKCRRVMYPTFEQN